MYDRILHPTDGSDVARAATEAAITFAKLFDADLHVVHVLETGDLHPGYEDEAADEFAHRGEEATERATELAADAGVDASGAILEQDQPVHRSLIAYADEHDADCIVMGTYGRTGLDRFVIGSVAERTLRESPVPVVTVHEDTVVESAFDSVLVPTDGSDCAMAAADHAIELAETTGAALHIVNVVDSGILWSDDVGTAREALEKAGTRAIDRVVDRADEADVSTVEASVLTGSPHRDIVAYADDRDVDCLVMGTHGRTGWDRYLLGSTTERVVRLAEIPVISIKERSEAPSPEE
ncbi:universal stress protein [Natrinema caseinilyticum]|uniref:universal stress protein n=1 Tax=Natrinema caseinilyticum TaxID=2961570 RepID=UPI0020C46C2D|nr:universal stress protein [Natrinema caseinilyticum]